MSIIIKNETQIDGIRKSCRLAAQILDFIADHVREGVTTEHLDNLIHQFIKDNGAKPAPLNYRGFPKASCISLNEVICHGIPSAYQLSKGDILNIDVTTILNGFFGDNSRMYTIDPISEKAEKLIKVTKECLDLGIKECYPGNRFGNIGYVIYNHARQHGYGVVYEFCGHGVGLKFHEDPEVPFVAKKDSGPEMKPGMIFTIEPMINEGKARAVIDKKDGWTARTIDKKLSAQYEHTILITPDGKEVMTDLKGEYDS